MSELGNKLQELRSLTGLTLKQVEEATGVSNAYLSQLENGKIKKPSANVLWKLSQMYYVDIEVLLLAAGIIQSDTNLGLAGNGEFKPYNLTPDEERQMLEYLAFLRSRKKQPLNK